MNKSLRKPSWLRAEMLGASNTANLTKMLAKYELHTVCESARCPNRGECFEKGSAVFLIMGDECTRNCRFCAIPTTAHPFPLDPDEPRRVAEMSQKLGLKHIIVTSVTRDDLDDGGAEHFKKTIKEIRSLRDEDVFIEVLTPDFKGKETAIDSVVNEKPTIFNHNLETIKRLYLTIRPQADYERSLSLLKRVKKQDQKVITKTGIMVGLGESQDEVLQLMRDARGAGVDMMTIGQYLQATTEHYPVQEYVHPKIFEMYQEEGMKMGFLYVESGPLVRSSYYSTDLATILQKN